jgi:predicted DNA-binding WGR domain protein
MSPSGKDDPARRSAAPRSFEYRDKTSDKFWEASVGGSTFVVRFGRRGTAGQTKRKDFGSPDAARAACDKMIAEKLREGYKELTSVRPGEQASTSGAPCTYDATLILPGGRKRELKLTTGKAADLPVFERLEFRLREGVTPAEVRTIVSDVNNRSPKAVGVHGSGIDDSTLPLLRELRNVVDMTVLGRTSDAGLQCITAHPGLEDLGVQWAQGTTDAGLAAVATLRRLKHLQFVLPGAFTNSGLEKLGALENLERLSLGELEKVTDEGLRILETLPKLEIVSVQGPKLTPEGLERLERARRENRKKAKTAGAPSKPAAAGELSAAVMDQLKRLGAKVVKTRKFPEDVASWPGPILTLTYGLKWPRGARYSPDEDSSVTVDGVQFAEGDHWVNCVMDDYAGCMGRSFAMWAQTSHHLIVVALDSADPSDPDVYCVDHEEMDEPLPDEISASEFLAELDRTRADADDDT